MAELATILQTAELHNHDIAVAPVHFSAIRTTRSVQHVRKRHAEPAGELWRVSAVRQRPRGLWRRSIWLGEISTDAAKDRAGARFDSRFAVVSPDDRQVPSAFSSENHSV